MARSDAAHARSLVMTLERRVHAHDFDVFEQIRHGGRVTRGRADDEQVTGTLRDPEQRGDADGFLAVGRARRVVLARTGSTQVGEPAAHRPLAPALRTAERALEDAPIPQLRRVQDQTRVRPADGAGEQVRERQVHARVRARTRPGSRGLP
jgi:hypothetical protein